MSRVRASSGGGKLTWPLWTENLLLYVLLFQWGYYDCCKLEPSDCLQAHVVKCLIFRVVPNIFVFFPGKEQINNSVTIMSTNDTVDIFCFLLMTLQSQCSAFCPFCIDLCVAGAGLRYSGTQGDVQDQGVWVICKGTNRPITTRVDWGEWEPAWLLSHFPL